MAAYQLIRPDELHRYRLWKWWLLAFLLLLACVRFWQLRGVAPTIVAESSAIRAGNSVELSGMGKPNTIVTLYAGSDRLGETDVNAGGEWFFSADLNTPGIYQISAKTKDGHGKIHVSNKETVTAILPPMITLSNTLTTGDGHLTGQGEPGSTIEIADGDEMLGRVTIDSNGQWRYPIQFDAPGTYDLVARSLNAYDDAIAETPFQVDVVMAAPTFALVDSNSETGDVTLEGTGYPGATVELLGNETLLGATVVDEQGNWSLIRNFPDDTAYQIEVRTTDAQGNVASSLVGQTVAVERETPLAVTESDVGEFDYNVDSTLITATVMVNGNGEPGAKIEVFLGEDLLADDVVSNDGGWAVSAETALAPGFYDVIISMVADQTNTQSDNLIINVPDLLGSFKMSYEELPDPTTESNEIEEDTIAAPNIELILDASWSMTELLNDTPRIEIAQSVLVDLVTDLLPFGTPMTLRAFGNIEGNYSCRTDLMVPLLPLDPPTMSAAILGIQPRYNANTPIADALLAVSEDMEKAGDPKIVILLTDGMETCGGDTTAAINALTEQGFDVRIDIVGLDIAEQALKKQFSDWATLGGGQFYDATNEEDLKNALGEALQVQYELVDEVGNVVAIGNVGGAPVIVPATTYTARVLTNPVRIIEDVVVNYDELTLTSFVDSVDETP